MTTTALPARAVAAPVLERLDGGAWGRVLGTRGDLAWAGIGEFVVLVSADGVPFLPNAVAVAGGSGALAPVRAGAPASYRPGLLRVGSVVVSWDPDRPPVWEPRVVPVIGDPGRIRRRGEALLRALGTPLPAIGRAGGGAWSGDTSVLVPLMAAAGVAVASEAGGASALGILLAAVARQDVAAAEPAGSALCGRGAGFIPEGDDLLASVLAGLATMGPAVGVQGPALPAWAGALIPRDAASRTSQLAHTVLRLAALGRVLQPAGCLLDLTAAGERGWPSALTRLLRTGHVNGRAYAAAIAATAYALTTGHRAGRLREERRAARSAAGPVDPGDPAPAQARVATQPSGTQPSGTQPSGT